MLESIKCYFKKKKNYFIENLKLKTNIIFNITKKNNNDTNES